MLSLRDRPGRGGRKGLSRRGSKGGTMGDISQSEFQGYGVAKIVSKR